MPRRVDLVEVGPRDGLQNEPSTLSTADKIDLIQRLRSAGLRTIEAGSFVSPRWVPKMADSKAVLSGLGNLEDTALPVLVPNLKGLDDALDAGVKEIAIFAAASETFSRRNINCSIDESYDRFALVCHAAHQHGLRIRGYLSCVLGCPYEGSVTPAKVAELSKRLLELGCYQISLGDTIGIGNPGAARRLVEHCASAVGIEHLAVHFHDTYGQALANIYAVLPLGIHTIDTAISGLGGCPYAKGSAGNVATEDVVYMLDGLGIHHGTNLEQLVDISEHVSELLDRPPASKVARAMLARRRGSETH